MIRILLAEQSIAEGYPGRNAAPLGVLAAHKDEYLVDAGNVQPVVRVFMLLGFSQEVQVEDLQVTIPSSGQTMRV